MSITDVITEGTIDVTLVEEFTEFYYEYYTGHLNEIIHHDSPSLTINYHDLEEYDEDVQYTHLDPDDRPLSDGIVNEPLEYYYSAREALRSICERDDAKGKIDNAPYDSIEDEDSNNKNPLAYADLRIKNNPNMHTISELRADDVTTMVSMEARVKKKTQVQPRVDVAAFKCDTCSHIHRQAQPLVGQMEYPDQCPQSNCSGTPVFDWDRSHHVNFERLEIEESPEGLSGGETPETIEFYNRGDTTGRVNPGERVTVTGILEPSDEDGNQPEIVFNTRVNGNNIVREEEAFEDIDITDEDEEEIKELASNPNIYELVTNSISPAIYGYDTQKFALALGLFGGVKKEVSGSYVRGDIHTLIVGDPGTAKSQLLEYAHDIAPRGVYTSGKGSSAAGLTASAVQEESLSGETTWTLEAGALPLADKGIAAIDEIDKMDNSDRDSLHEALESQSISINKAGINATLKSRAAVMAAANPKYGEFDQYEAISEQIELDPALISRFDLIFTITDEPDEDRDAAIADVIIKTNQAEQSDEKQEEVSPPIGPDLFRKYVAYARNNCFPELPDDVAELLKDYYVDLRQQGDDGVRPATARQLQGLVRLAEASARMRLSDTVDEQDAERAIDIIEASMKDVAMDPETGEFDADILEAGVSNSERDRLEMLENIIGMLEDEYDDGVPVDEIQDMVNENVEDPMDEKTLEKTLERLRRDGGIYEPRSGHYKTV